MQQRPRNPFRTRNTKPGALNYIFASSDSATEVVARLQETNWRGQIVGPHGSGKSTLLSNLIPVCTETFHRDVKHFTLTDRQRRLPVQLSDCDDWNSNTLVIVDGYEQLSWASRLRLRRFCFRKKCGLLVTTHRKVLLPVLLRTTASFETTRLIVRQLVPNDSWIRDDDIAQAFADCKGDVREVLFALYDVYDDRRQLTSAVHP